ncbi:hypothetical protein JXB02_01245 [Candidatus Woesearchaeota archaeon]|nr:hypothetical protein [Candidatus Woesearchaeota archaeon]
MDEIETKILEIDVRKTKAKLESLGATKVFEGPVRTVFFDRQDTLRSSGRMLRVRQKGAKAYITAKRRKADAEVRVSDEQEAEVPDFDAACALLETVGFGRREEISRKQTSYRIKGSLAEIREYADQPPVLEIESPTKEELKEVVALLGYRMTDTTTMTGFEVRERYGL